MHLPPHSTCFTFIFKVYFHRISISAGLFSLPLSILKMVHYLWVSVILELSFTPLSPTGSSIYPMLLSRFFSVFSKLTMPCLGVIFLYLPFGSLLTFLDLHIDFFFSTKFRKLWLLLLLKDCCPIFFLLSEIALLLDCFRYSPKSH